MTFTLPVEFVGKTSQNGLTVLATLSVDKSTPYAAPYRDVGSFVESPSASYGRTLTFPDGFEGWIIYHTGTVGVGSDFTGVTVLAAEPISTALAGVSIADEILKRAVQNVEDTADKHSLGALVLLATNSVVGEDTDTTGTVTAKKPSDDSTFQVYNVTLNADGKPVTGVN